MENLGIVALIVAVIASIFGVKNILSDSEEERDFKREKKDLEKKRQNLEEARKEFEDNDGVLKERQRQIESEIREINKEIVERKEKNEEVLENLDSLSDDELTERANNALYGSNSDS